MANILQYYRILMMLMDIGGKKLSRDRCLTGGDTMSTFLRRNLSFEKLSK